MLTSLWEGLPIALLEAMADSKPIAAYDTDNAREIIKDREADI
ncbi:MAG: glycosyltransferase [Candidatus Omnitrophica bacterium]|nr:glycosyltransferase [Candidatus Omnitrophota bacterium]MBU1925729.1 glycosyltransferase [Candidatus Omnitrophota bacterium]MBU2062943.1 glycosyltransferase [Candidatus Omnitrophota bacterium]